MIQIKLANLESDFKLIAQLADAIWREHYIPIIGKPQIDYMLDKYQSSKVIKTQIEEGYKYFVLVYENTPVGYIAITTEEDALFLSKIYVLRTYRGKKIGTQALKFIENKARELNLKRITLTVNKNNHSAIKAYEKLGFENLGPKIMDIGNGFIMDDYKMAKVI